jgi:tetratricopeptide (TPR) repeat protein
MIIKKNLCQHAIDLFCPNSPVFAKNSSVLSIALVLICVNLAHANDPPTWPAKRIVVAEQARIFVGDKPIAAVTSGRILQITQANGPWLLVPDLGGWIHSDTVRPLDFTARQLDAELRKNPTPEKHHLRGIIALEFRDLKRAITEFETARKGGLDTAALHVNLGNAYQESGQLEQALTRFTAALKADPENVTAYENRASVLAQLGQYRASLADSDRSVQLDPSRPEAWNNRAVTRLAVGNREGALTDFAEALRLKPDYLDALSNRALSHREAGQDAAAIKDYDRILAFDAYHAETLNELAWLLSTSPNRPSATAPAVSNWRSGSMS